jgi:uncharacterized RDD family membrane protein YckC
LRACACPKTAHKRKLMATPTPTAAPEPTFADFIAGLKKRAEPYLVPYYLTFAAVIGAVTVGFIVLTLLIVLVATNFNVLGLIE